MSVSDVAFDPAASALAKGLFEQARRGNDRNAVDALVGLGKDRILAQTKATWEEGEEPLQLNCGQKGVVKFDYADDVAQVLVNDIPADRVLRPARSKWTALHQAALRGYAPEASVLCDEHRALVDDRCAARVRPLDGARRDLEPRHQVARGWHRGRIRRGKRRGKRRGRRGRRTGRRVRGPAAAAATCCAAHVAQRDVVDTGTRDHLVCPRAGRVRRDERARDVHQGRVAAEPQLRR